MDNITRPAEIGNQDLMEQTDANSQEYTQTQLQNIYDYLDNVATTLNSISVLDQVYPVGSIYISINNTNPSTFIGGTWEQLSENYYLMASKNGGGSAVSGTSNTRDISHTHKQRTKTMGCYDSGTYTGMAYGADTRLIVKDNTYDTYSGGSTSLNIQPASLAVCMWKRTK